MTEPVTPKAAPQNGACTPGDRMAYGWFRNDPLFIRILPYSFFGERRAVIW